MVWKQDYIHEYDQLLAEYPLLPTKHFADGFAEEYTVFYSNSKENASDKLLLFQVFHHVVYRVESGASVTLKNIRNVEQLKKLLLYK